MSAKIPPESEPHDSNSQASLPPHKHGLGRSWFSAALWITLALLVSDFLIVRSTSLGIGHSRVMVGLLSPWLVFTPTLDASGAVDYVARFRPSAFSFQSGVLALVFGTIVFMLRKKMRSLQRGRAGFVVLLLGWAVWTGSYFLQRSIQLSTLNEKSEERLLEQNFRRLGRLAAEQQSRASVVLEPMPPDIADVPALDLQAENDPNKRFFLIGLDAERTAPPNGYKLLLVLPGGHGGADFTYFIRRIYKNDLDEEWLVAQLVAPQWDAAQKVVWPLSFRSYPGAEFTTEEFAKAVISDVRGRTNLDDDAIYMLGWSSGGPPVYAITLSQEFPIRGAFVAMSVFWPQELQPLSRAKGKRFFLLQSPDDKVTKFVFAEHAEQALKAAGAQVRLHSYRGGHGWGGNRHENLRLGIRWIETGE